MMQADLFDSFSIAQYARDIGIRRAAEHAHDVDPKWNDKAIGYVRLHAVAHSTFLAEDVREMAEADGLSAPADGRAWGHVMRGARRAGIIERIGYAPAKSSNLSPKTLWKAIAA